MNLRASTDGSTLRYRCEGCGAFVKAEEIEAFDSHERTEYEEDGTCYPVLCGPVSLGAWHD
jgi:hypothetical protein